MQVRKRQWKNIFKPKTIIFYLRRALKVSIYLFLSIINKVRKLGVLNQHPPKCMFIPKRYYQVQLPKNPPLISIVTPSYNQGNFIERTLLSVLNQSYPALQYIVQDGGSQDNTRSILERYHAQLAYWESKRDQGQSHAINLGFTHASGDIMAYLNSDDILLPGTLSYVASYFQKHPKVDVVYGHRIIIDENDKEIGRWILPTHSAKALTWSDWIPQETLFWRKRIWDKVGGLDESFRFAMDWDLLLRFMEAKANFVRLPRFLGAFRLHTQQKTSAIIHDIGIREMNKLRKRCHQRTVTQQDIFKKTFFYHLRAMQCHFLYQLGLLRY